MSKLADTKRRALLILGMHRSGTSAVTRVVNLLGAKIGDQLVPPGHDNPSGFWENATAVEINEQLLSDLGRTWYDMREMPDGWMETAAAAKSLDLAIEFIRRDLGDSAICAVKDPRICLTAPLWIKAFETLEFEVSCLFVTRDPREVVESLHRRNDWPRSPLYLMWVQYLLEAEAAARGHHRVMVSYDQVLDDWRACMERVAKALRLTWPVRFDDAATAIDAFLDRGQRHHRAADETGDAMPSLVRSLHNLSLEIAEGKADWNAISELRSNFRRAAELYAERVDAVLTERWNVEAKLQTAESRLAERGSMEHAFQQATQKSREALELRLIRLDEHVTDIEKQVQIKNAEMRDARQDIGELGGRILRQQEVLQTVEARLQRQYALLNTVLLRLEQVAADRLADRISGLTGKVDAMTEKVDAIRGAEMMALRQDLESNKARLSGLLRSTSWRLTRPLRWISVHLLRRPPANE